MLASRHRLRLLTSSGSSSGASAAPCHPRSSKPSGAAMLSSKWHKASSSWSCPACTCCWQLACTPWGGWLPIRKGVCRAMLNLGAEGCSWGVDPQTAC
eukprot:scaffold37145_cov17-Tisochrysis_lutea.AAC.3